jgi:endonuclease III
LVLVYFLRQMHDIISNKKAHEAVGMFPSARISDAELSYFCMYFQIRRTMTTKERYRAFIDYFTRHQPEVATELTYENSFQLLLAVILSAQCTDKRVNIVTPALFQAFPTPMHMAHSNFEEIFPYIKSISYPSKKAKYLLNMARMVVENFAGVIPEQAEDLQKLSGVGRKTAHVIVAVLHNQPKMAVDTHVFRVSKRLGLVHATATTPLAVEKQLIQHLPEAYIAKAHHWLILHGRYVCLARKPKCQACALTSFCCYFAQRIASG